MAGFNATLDQVEQMIQSNEIAQLQEAKRMLDELCLPADFTEFARNVGGWSFLTAIASGKPELEQKLMKQVILGLTRVLDSYHLLGNNFLLWGAVIEAGGYSEDLLQQAKSCRQAMLELTHEINPYQELKDFILLQAHLELAKLAGVENDTELFQKYLKICYELPDQPDDAQFMNMKRAAKELPKKFEPTPSATKRATNNKPKSATNSSSTSGGIDQTKLIGIIAVVVIALLVLYACGAA